ncbi:polyprotein [Plakobranchus ocellatus]|uniref:Polyprotein n=1 Tax=Plakobranchus ocellatus TaxID=259542 RepID=A0AAV3YD59_9GAST|nr:polyprotein [Plakobranchus ocellatus]
MLLKLHHCKKSPDDLEKFIKDKGLEASDNLTDPTKLELYQLLFAKRKAFVSKDNPDLGKCDIAEMSIRLILDARPKHQKPYRLSPDKKKVLEHQLEHLLEQGIIAPLSAHEDIPITSPVVLVEKRTKSETKNTSEKERSLRSYRV